MRSPKGASAAAATVEISVALPRAVTEAEFCLAICGARVGAGVGTVGVQPVVSVNSARKTRTDERRTPNERDCETALPLVGRSKFEVGRWTFIYSDPRFFR